MQYTIWDSIPVVNSSRNAVWTVEKLPVLRLSPSSRFEMEDGPGHMWSPVVSFILWLERSSEKICLEPPNHQRYKICEFWIWIRMSNVHAIWKWVAGNGSCHPHARPVTIPWDNTIGWSPTMTKVYQLVGLPGIHHYWSIVYMTWPYDPYAIKKIDGIHKAHMADLCGELLCAACDAKHSVHRLFSGIIVNLLKCDCQYGSKKS